MSFDPVISEWGNPVRYNLITVRPTHNRTETTLGTETSKYQEEKKERFDSLSSGERKGRSPNPQHANQT